MTGTDELPQQAGEVLLRELSCLESEIQTAMSAIAANDVAALECSLREQEVLCANLDLLLRTVTPDLSPSSAQRVQAAVNSVRDLSRSYLLLLRHASTNAEQLKRLCRTYTL